MKKPNGWQDLKRMAKLSIRDCLKQAEARLKHIENPNTSALILMAHVLNMPKTWLLAHPENTLDECQKEVFLGLVSRLSDGEPLPYLTGTQSFYGLDFKVSPAVLIPRPETELLVEEALSWLSKNPEAQTALDVGTGSGCIAISLLKNNESIKITALDISNETLKIASENAKSHQVSHCLDLVHSNLLSQFNGQTSLICANLPYIPSQTLQTLAVTEWEPALALDGGEDGLKLIRDLLSQSQKVLKAPGLILLEIEESTGEKALEAAKQAYPQASIALLRDLAGKNRLIRIEVPA
mgnify:FL=1